MLKAGLRLLSLTIVATLLSGLLNIAPASAGHPWDVSISQPKSPTNSAFNVAFNVFSTEKDDKFTVKLFQNGSEVDSKSISTDFGDSGKFARNLANGTYEFFVRALITAGPNAGHPTIDSDKVTVVVDKTAPQAPNYFSKDRSGNTYSLGFSTAADGQTSEVRVYASTSPSFTANTASQVGVVNIGPGQTTTFNYSAPDSAERFFAMQSFDNANNFSPLVADPEATVTQGEVSTPGGSTSTDGTPDSVEEGGDVGSGTTDEGGEVAAAADSGSISGWIVLLVALILFGIYLFLMLTPTGQKLLNNIKARFRSPAE